nr:hypothetical protein [Tanacetum cinerariifolium]
MVENDKKFAFDFVYLPIDFKNAEGMNTIVDQSPWMFNEKPLMIQKCSFDVCVKKAEPNRIPVWVKLFNIPLEAWSVKGISALASRLGKPLVMGDMTASMCHNGTGRHSDSRCYKNGTKKDQMKNNKGTKINHHNEGFVEVRHRRYGFYRAGNNKRKKQVKESTAVNGKGENASGEFLPFVISDHSVVVVIIPEGLKIKKISFIFVNYIGDKEEFVDCFGQVWESEIIGCHMYKVVQKLKRLKKPLNRLNWKNGNLSEKVTSLKEKLTNAQAEIEKDPFNIEKKAKAASFLNEYLVASNDELKLLQQRVKIKRLSESDQNTAYFHGILKSRKHKGRIKSICDEKGVKFDGDNVATTFVEHLKSFLGSKHDVQPLDSIEIKFDEVLSKEEAEDMIGLVTDEEIKEAVFDIYSNKASGPNGYTPGFFKKAWHIVGKEVCLAIKDFFMNGKLLGEINATLPFSNQNNSELKQLWKISKGKESLWVKWVNVVKLIWKSIWDTEVNCNDSCGWKKLLDLRNKIKKHVLYSFGNGRKVSVWFNKWDIKGPLSDFIPQKRLFNTYPELCNIAIPILSNGVNDKVCWLNNQKEKKEFSTNQVWIDLRDNAKKVEWHHVVWFSQFQPRHAFILWLALKERLATQDRLARWNNQSNDVCPLCKKDKDSHAHLFFKCEFAKQIYEKLKNKMRCIRSNNELKNIVSFLSKSKAKKNLGKVFRPQWISQSISDSHIAFIKLWMQSHIDDASEFRVSTKDPGHNVSFRGNMISIVYNIVLAWVRRGGSGGGSLLRQLKSGPLGKKDFQCTATVRHHRESSPKTRLLSKTAATISTVLGPVTAILVAEICFCSSVSEVCKKC